MRFSSEVSVGPAANLPLQISLRFAEIGQIRGCVIYAMQAYQVFDKGFAQAPCCFCGELQTGRQLLTNDDAVNRLHQVKGSAQHGLIATIEKHLRSWTIDCVKLG